MLQWFSEVAQLCVDNVYDDISVDEKQAVSQEVKLLSDLHHTNIVQYKVSKATVVT